MSHFFLPSKYEQIFLSSMASKYPDSNNMLENTGCTLVGYLSLLGSGGGPSRPIPDLANGNSQATSRIAG